MHDFYIIFVRFGRKKFLILATVMEILANLGAALAPDIYSFTVFRFMVAVSEMGMMDMAIVIGILAKIDNFIIN